jgi:plastocyanin
MSRSPRLWARVLGAALALSLLAPVGSVFAQDAGPVVDMQGLQFVPTEIHAAPGATITWTNSSAFPHTVTADDGSFDSGNLDAGAVFTMTFDAPGIYTYYCLPHKSIGMLGVVVIDGAAAAGPSMDPPADAPQEAMAPDDTAAPAAPTRPTPRPRSPDDYTPDH